MAEAEDVLVDAARHAFAWVQRRRRAPPAWPRLADAAPRLALLLAALHGEGWALRVAQPPAPPGWRVRWQRAAGPRETLPSARGHTIWLPRELPFDAETAAQLWRAMALQQAQRLLRRADTAPTGTVALALEAQAADAELLHALPGLAPALARLRAEALARRPPGGGEGERWLRARLAEPVGTPTRSVPDDAPLPGDWWTGGPAPTDAAAGELVLPVQGTAPGPGGPPRAVRLRRRPSVRAARPDEDDPQPGAWMVQTAAPHESAEDPFGANRPVDRDTDAAPEGHAESLAELPEARLVRSTAPARELLLSDDPPAASRAAAQPRGDGPGIAFAYPEWDWRRRAYRRPGTTVWEIDAAEGPAEWVEHTLAAQRATLDAVRRRFEALRARRETLRRREDGDEPDLDACLDAAVERRAGASPSSALYRQVRRARRDTAIVVLVDVSASTDAWVAGTRRVIDVEREALLALAVALHASGDAFALLAFSGEGPQGVVVRRVKRFDEPHGAAVARRIAGLEPERCTRSGAALRHASAWLAAQPAEHRLLLLLSDGRPHDVDEYEGRHGVEDLRQAVAEARAAGQRPFGLTVDRHAADWLPRVFGPGQHALLPRPEHLPGALLGWMRQILG